MVSRKAKKIFPLGTFLPTPMRVLAILQLCTAFTTICLYAGHPFMGALFNQRAKLSLFEIVMGTLPGMLEKQQLYNREQFGKLDPAKHQMILNAYYKLQAESNRPFLTKCSDSIKILLLEMPPFTKGWVFFSILLSILLLRKKEGAATACWILPILSVAFAFDSYHAPSKSTISPEERLFPNEEILLQKFLKEPLKPNILEQHAQLKRGWELFLIHEWAKEAPLTYPEYEKQVFKGELAFNLKRLELRIKNPSASPTFLAGVSYNPLLFYLFCFWWNLFFAWFMNRNKWRYRYI